MPSMSGSSGRVMLTRIVDDVAGMSHPLAADDELVVDGVAEGIAHAAVIAGEADAALDRRGEVLDLFLLDLRHREDRHDQAEIMDRGIGEEPRCRVLDIDLEAVFLEHGLDDFGALLAAHARSSRPRRSVLHA